MLPFEVCPLNKTWHVPKWLCPCPQMVMSMHPWCYKCISCTFIWAQFPRFAWHLRLRDTMVCDCRVSTSASVEIFLWTLQVAILNQFPSNLVRGFNMTRAQNLLILAAPQFQLWPPGGHNQNNCTLSCQRSTDYSSQLILVSIWQYDDTNRF